MSTDPLECSIVMRAQTRFTFLLLTLPMVAFTVVGGYLGQVVAREDAYRHLRIFEDVVSLITENYVEEADLDDVMTGALRGLMNGLDTDSAYLSPAQVARIESGAPVAAGGIGVETTSRYYTQIVAVRDRSPAFRAGLQPGDYIRAIDGEPTRRRSSLEGAELLRGAPGSTVRLSLLRGSTSEPYDIDLVREAGPHGPLVLTYLLPDAIGYLRVAEFSTGAAAELERAVGKLTDDGASQLLIDVRSCAGGVFEEGIAAARLFVASGTLLQRVETGGGRTPVEAAGGGAIDVPLVLLTDHGTADAAELFAAGLTTGSGRATAIGQRTAGRASLRKLVKLPDGSGLWLSWARYLHASGEPLHRAGVEPEIVVNPPRVELGEPAPAGDPILERALDHLQGQVAA